MSFKPSTPASRLYLASAIVLAVGLIAAALVYFLAANPASTDAAGYSVVGGSTYALTLAESTRELQQVERLGGMPAVYALEFHRWFLSLWHGQRLAYTLAALSVAAASLCFYIARLTAEGLDD